MNRYPTPILTLIKTCVIILVSCHSLRAQTSSASSSSTANDYSNIGHYSNNDCSIPKKLLLDDTFNINKNIAYPPPSDHLFIQLHDVKACEYCAFLNSIGATDTFGVYLEKMGTDPETGSIIRNGYPGKYYYTLINGRENFPISYVSCSNAARYSNWLNNAKATGEQSLDTTETGTYYLDDLNNSSSDPKIKDDKATCYLPPESQEEVMDDIDPFITSNVMNFQIVLPTPISTDLDPSNPSMIPPSSSSVLKTTETVATNAAEFLFGNVLQEFIEILIAQMLGWWFVPLIIITSLALYLYNKKLGLGFASHAVMDFVIWSSFQYFHINLPSALYQQLENIGLEFIATPFIKCGEAFDSFLHYFGFEHSHMPISSNEGNITYSCMEGCTHPPRIASTKKPSTLNSFDSTPNKEESFLLDDFYKGRFCQPCTGTEESSLLDDFYTGPFCEPCTGT